MHARLPVRTRQALLSEIRNAAQRPMERLGQTLIGMGLITEADLASALAAQRDERDCPVGEMLVRHGRISAEQLETALNLKLGFAVVDVERFEVEPPALAKVPWALVARLQALPLVLDQGHLIVAMADPKRQDQVDELAWASGCWVRPVLADGHALRRRIAGGPERLGQMDELTLSTWSASTPSSTPDSPTASASSIAAMAAEAAASAAAGASEPGSPTALPEDEHALVRMLNGLLIEAQELGASDIHVETQPGRGSVRIRLRCDGILRPHLELPPTVRQALVARIKVMARLDTAERRRPQDGRIRLERGAGQPPIDLRVATLPTREGLEDVVMRLLTTAEPVPLDRLGMQPQALEQFRQAVMRPHGLILCAGPTGSGKTTTLHSALALLNTPQRKIWTAEDPIEIVQPGLCQVQVQPRLDWTFGKALRAFLRADPDVIMVGEIRDRETAQVAVEAALTGHLVLSTIHTNSAAETVARLLDMGLDPFLLADSLQAVVGQRLVRRRCPHCAPPQAHGPDVPPACPRCDGSGFKGRLGLHEVLTASRDVRRLIQQRAGAESIQAAAIAAGMRPLRQDGLDKVAEGLTSMEEVLAACSG